MKVTEGLRSAIENQLVGQRQQMKALERQLAKHYHEMTLTEVCVIRAEAIKIKKEIARLTRALEGNQRVG